MITIQVNHEVSTPAFDRVRELANRLPMNDPSFNGAEVQVIRSYFTCVDDEDEIRGASLLSQVYAAIDS